MRGVGLSWLVPGEGRTQTRPYCEAGAHVVSAWFRFISFTQRSHVLTALTLIFRETHKHHEFLGPGLRRLQEKVLFSTLSQV